MLRPLTLAVVVSLAASIALTAAPPVLERIEPPGAQRGSAFRLELYGLRLPAGAQLITGLPASVTPLASDRRDGGPALSYLVELHENAPIGLYPIRLETETGLSNLMLFSVGEFPDVAEQESHQPASEASNDSADTAQAIETPVAINGRLQSADRDVYRFAVKAGDMLTLEVEARRAGSAIDPVLRLLDADGEQIAVNNDAAGIGLDSRLRFEAPHDGVFYAVVHDTRYSDQRADFYRLKIGDFDFAEGFFPLGGKRGDTVDVEWFGGGFDKAQSGSVDLSAHDDDARWIQVRAPGKPGALPTSFVVGDREEQLEGKDRTLAPGHVMNGRIADSGEVDRYKLAVQAGQSWRISVDAAELGSSQLFPLLSVFHGDELLARSGDEIPEKGTTTLEENTFVSRDPFIHLEIPEGARELDIVVEDLVDRGGPAFGYRLLAEQGPPDFELTLNTPDVTIPGGGVAYVSATAVRRGFGGPIQLKVEDLPAGVEAQGGHIAEAILTKERVGVVSSGILALRAEPDAPRRTLQLSVFGEATLPDGTIVRRRASAPGLVTAIRSRPGIRARLTPARADWLGAELPAQVTEGYPARIVLDGPSEVRIVKGTEYPLRWKLESDDPSIKGLSEFSLNTVGARESTFSPRDPEADRDGEAYVKYLRTTMGGPAQKFNVVLTAEARINGMDEVLSSPVITIEVVEGFELKPADDRITAAPGGEFTIAGAIERDAAFDNPVTVKAEDLPQGVACAAAAAPKGQARFELRCQAASDAGEGLHEIRLIGSSVMAGRGEGKDVPYQVDPVLTTLAVVKR